MKLALSSWLVEKVALKCLGQYQACSRSPTQTHRELSALKEHMGAGFTESLMTPDEDTMLLSNSLC